MVFEFEVRRSERNFWKRRVRNDLLVVDMSIGNRVCNNLYLVSELYQNSRASGYGRT